VRDILFPVGWEGRTVLRLLETFLPLPARPPDRSGVKMKLLNGEHLAPGSEGRGILFCCLKPKCIIWKNNSVVFRARKLFIWMKWNLENCVRNIQALHGTWGQETCFAWGHRNSYTTSLIKKPCRDGRSLSGRSTL